MITEVVKLILEAKKKTEYRRSTWRNTTKKVITNALEKAVNTFDVHEIGGFVTSSKVYKNFEAIQLSLGNEYSGITERNENGALRNFMKKNGYINFAQLISGKIVVVYTSPSVEIIGADILTEVIEKIEPSDVTEEWVLDHVEKFLNKYLDYENEWK